MDILKKKQCHGFVPSTRERCEKYALRGTKYCWHHQSKIPITIAILGLITSLIFPKVLEYCFPPAQIENIQKHTEPIPAMAKDIEQLPSIATGGDSYFLVQFWDSGNNVIMPSIVHVGKYTLYDCRFKLMDLDLNDSVKEYRIGNIGPGLSFFLQNGFEIKQRDLIRMKADISARNGFFVEMIHGRNINQIWRFAIRLSTFNGKLLFEEIPDGFPKDENGKYDWNSRT